MVASNTLCILIDEKSVVLCKWKIEETELRYTVKILSLFMFPLGMLFIIVVDKKAPNALSSCYCYVMLYAMTMSELQHISVSREKYKFAAKSKICIIECNKEETRFVCYFMLYFQLKNNLTCIERSQNCFSTVECLNKNTIY